MASLTITYPTDLLRKHYQMTGLIVMSQNTMEFWMGFNYYKE